MGAGLRRGRILFCVVFFGGRAGAAPHGPRTCSVPRRFFLFLAASRAAWPRSCETKPTGSREPGRARLAPPHQSLIGWAGRARTRPQTHFTALGTTEQGRPASQPGAWRRPRAHLGRPWARDVDAASSTGACAPRRNAGNMAPPDAYYAGAYAEPHAPASLSTRGGSGEASHGGGRSGSGGAGAGTGRDGGRDADAPPRRRGRPRHWAWTHFA